MQQVVQPGLLVQQLSGLGRIASSSSPHRWLRTTVDAIAPEPVVLECNRANQYPTLPKWANAKRPQLPRARGWVISAARHTVDISHEFARCPFNRAPG